MACRETGQDIRDGLGGEGETARGSPPPLKLLEECQDIKMKFLWNTDDGDQRIHLFVLVCS